MLFEFIQNTLSTCHVAFTCLFISGPDRASIVISLRYFSLLHNVSTTNNLASPYKLFLCSSVEIVEDDIFGVGQITLIGIVHHGCRLVVPSLQSMCYIVNSKLIKCLLRVNHCSNIELMCSRC